MLPWDSVRIRDLERFAAVVEAGGFTAAAGALDESPKQLSRRVGQLEEELGVRLFHRTTRSVRPTPEASEWYPEVRAALDRLQDATEAIRTEDSMRGRVRIQVPTLFVDTVLDWIAGALQQHPDLAIDLLVGDRADDLLARGIDLCLSGIPPESGATVRVRRLGTSFPVLAAHPAYLARWGAPEQPADLAEHACLRFVAGDSQHVWSLTHEDGRVVEVPVGGRLACNDSRALRQALTAGLGIGPLDAPGETDLEVVLPGWRFGGIPLFLTLAPGRRRLARVRLVAEALADIANTVIRGLPARGT